MFFIGGGGGRGGEKWSDWGYILKLELRGFVYRLDGIRGEKDGRVKDVFSIWFE